MRIATIVLVFAVIAGCSTEPIPTNSIRLEFAYKQSRPTADSLSPIFPNPFNRAIGDTALWIEFTVMDTISSSALLIQNPFGDPVAQFSDSALKAGVYSGWWDPIASDGTRLTNGIYFVTLQNGAFINSRLVNLQDNE